MVQLLARLLASVALLVWKKVARTLAPAKKHAQIMKSLQGPQNRKSTCKYILTLCEFIRLCQGVEYEIYTFQECIKNAVL